MGVETELNIWKAAWDGHFHREYEDDGEGVPFHYHSPDFAWGVGFEIVLSLFGEVGQIKEEDVAKVLKYFKARYRRLKEVRDKIDLCEFDPAARQGMVLEMAGAEVVLCAMIAMLTELLEGNLQPE